MSDDVQFVCSACSIDYQEDKEKVMTACRLCGKLHCSDCVDEFGRCVTCKDEDGPTGD